MGNLGKVGFKSDSHKGVFPEGRFSFLIQTSRLVDAKKDGLVIGVDWEFRLQCLSPSQMNRPLIRRMAYERERKDPKIVQQLEIGLNQIADICRAVGVPNLGDTNELDGKKFETDVTIKGDYNNLSKISQFVRQQTLPAGRPSDRKAVVVTEAKSETDTSAPEGWGDEPVDVADEPVDVADEPIAQEVVNDEAPS